MKGRSHRLPPSEPPDDWGDGSWTVDCSCGVTFDDGEEMVSCDECGVWVHTRCSRFTKGEASFACHNCKAAAAAANRRPRRSPSFPSDDTEETEVAQFLIELPTKTDPFLPPHRPPFRLWTDVPIEDRVHVQGVPGGDPGLFQGLSSVFTSELWRCTGYVPKKFNFRYREFPCWDEEDGENQASRGADVLFSLSKEKEAVPCVPVRTFERKVSPDRVRKAEGEKASSGGGCSLSSGKKERSKLRTFGASSGKKRKEEAGEGKDRSAKKKSRIDVDKALGDSKKRGSVPIIDVNKTELREDGDFQVADSGIPDRKSGDRKEEMPMEPSSTDHPEGTDNGVDHKHLIDVKASVEAFSGQGMKQKSSMEIPMKIEKAIQPDPVRTEIPQKTDVGSDGKGSVLPEESVKEEVVGKAGHVLKQPKDESHFEGGVNGSACSIMLELENSKPATGDLTNSHHAVLETPNLSESSSLILPSSKLDKTEVKIEMGDHQSAGNSKSPFYPVTDGKLHSMDHLPYNLQKPPGQSSESLRDILSVTASPFDEPKAHDVKKEPELSHQGCDNMTEATFASFNDHNQCGLEVESATSPPEQVSSELRHCLVNVDGTMKSDSQNQSHSVSGGRKLVLGAGKASSTSSVPVISRSVSGIYKSQSIMTSSTSRKAVHLIKHRVKVSACTVSKKDNAATAVSSEESTQEVSRQPAKGHPKGSISSGSKSSQTSRTFVSASKHTLSDSKEQLLCPSSKAEETTVVLGSGETNESSQTQTASVQIKMSSNSSQKNEKTHQPIPLPSSKVFNSSMPMHPPAPVNATTTLSDEELALLLHQELNSSPRVPRVPRVRQAAGMQLAPTTSVLSKRSSGSSGKDQRSSRSGGKDHVSGSKRKDKEDASRESSRNSREINDETRRICKVQSSPEWKHQESSFMSDGSAKKDTQNRSSDTVTSVKKNIPLASTVGTNSGPPSSEATGSTSSIRNSPKDVPSDDGTLASRTLPGLIDEIMSKNRHITYEELCDAVHPYWNDLRKPNGERYAYPSHLHAVHDCLRNRSEWAHLIDLAPKTNSSKKRRKLDSDMPTTESENEKAKNKASGKVEDRGAESHHEDFPKGKRKARKRRWLELRGRGVKEARKRRNQDAASDDDPDTFSHSSNEGKENLFSEDESPAVGSHAVGADLSSSSSDDT
ncbi:uncharacterized protein LOC103722918 [Phoenix dactylifera]|uniref:Uncharacterized protein LOC103722918 n=1 Tax=Phoenix dactylifera TaxID=42345 RepID=A0A8B7D383_PHODC|nr:uncharacterized protein LOC103722918 [Phoenix dactylifera]